MRERYGYVYYGGNAACIDIDDKGFIVGHLLYYFIGEIPTLEIAFQEAIRLCETMILTIKFEETLKDAMGIVAHCKYNLDDYIIEQLEDDTDGSKRWRITDKEGGN